ENANIDDVGVDDYFGMSLNINSTNDVFIGAMAEDLSGVDNGVVYIYEIPPLTLTYSVNFDSNGGSVVASISDLEEGDLISKPANPTKADYNFIAWYSNENLTNEWNFNTDTMPAGNLTLYAKWKIDIDIAINEFLDNSSFGTPFGKVFIAI